MAENIGKHKSTTSIDVAKEAGVSQSTVSRVFNEKTRKLVKPQVIERVEKVAKKMGYRPNLLARSMISGKTNIIALVVGENPGPYYNKVINLFISYIQKLGKQCLLFQVIRQCNIGDIISKVIQFKVDAVIITAAAMTETMVNICKEEGIATILFNRYIPKSDITTVCSNAIEGSTIASKYLIKNGHKKIAYIRYIKDTQEEKEKYIGFYSTLKKAELDIFIEKRVNYIYEDGYNVFKSIMEMDKLPTAIFCTSDIIAMGIMDCAKKEYGIRIPEDLSIIGYDDMPICKWESYALTTIRQPINSMVERAIDLLQNMLENNNDTKKTHIFKPTLIKRRTVKNINVSKKE